MSDCRVLAIDADRLAAWHRRSDALAVEAEFTADAGGLAAFADYLRRHPDADFRLLADLADEEFEIDDIPAVRGRDRRALVARRLDQLHFGTPWKTALSCGRRKEGRRDERVLFAALTRPQAIAPWTKALESADAAVAGLYSAAQLVERLPCVNDRRRRPQLLVVTLGRAGLRQTYLEFGRLRFSRLMPLADAAEAPTACAAETAKLRQYLSRQFADDVRLPVLVVAAPAHLERYRAAGIDSAGLGFEYASLDDEARRMRLKGRQESADALFAHLLMRARPSAQFAPDALRSGFLLRRADRGIRRAAWLALAVGLAAGGAQAVDAWRLRQDSESLRALATADAVRYEARLHALPPAPLPVERMRAVLARYDEAARHSPTPAAAYRSLAAVLTDSPEVVLERLDWKLMNDATGPHTALDVHASLTPALAGDPRAQLAITDGLAHALQSAPDVRVQVIAPPFSADPAKPLTSKAIADAGKPRFSLRLLQPLR